MFLLNDLRNDPTSDEFKGEYHRFAAELMPVERERVARSLVLEWIPVAPARSEATLGELVSPRNDVSNGENEPVDGNAELIGQSAGELRSTAESAFRMRNYSVAVEAFDALANKGDTAKYNDVAKSKHGASLWRLAESEGAQDMDRMARLDRAIQLLDTATNHRDPDYRARAFYEKSKALWHKWKHTADPAILCSALDCASNAATLQYEPAYISWFEKVRDGAEADAPDDVEPRVQESAVSSLPNGNLSSPMK